VGVENFLEHKYEKTRWCGWMVYITDEFGAFTTTSCIVQPAERFWK